MVPGSEIILPIFRGRDKQAKGMPKAATILLILGAASAVVPRYFAIGFTHILPYGIDHMLFLLALFFLNRGFPDLLKQLTLFTMAHSLTLGLSIYGVVDAPEIVVEAAIALSITLAAAENLFTKRIRPWLPWIVFASGLVHGLGFAHSFGETPVGKADFLAALFSFNLGIEAGQIVVIGAVSLLASAWWKRDSYQRLVARPASCLIAAIGVCWAIVRIA